MGVGSVFCKYSVAMGISAVSKMASFKETIFCVDIACHIGYQYSITVYIKTIDELLAT